MKPFFQERLFGRVEHVYSGTYGHTKGSAESLYSRAQELVKGGQRWSKAKTAVGVEGDGVATAHGKNTCSYVYVRSIGRPNYGDCQP